MATKDGAIKVYNKSVPVSVAELNGQPIRDVTLALWAFYYDGKYVYCSEFGSELHLQIKPELLSLDNKFYKTGKKAGLPMRTRRTPFEGLPKPPSIGTQITVPSRQDLNKYQSTIDAN